MKLRKIVRRTQSVKFATRNPRAKKTMDFRRMSDGITFKGPRYSRKAKYVQEW